MVLLRTLTFTPKKSNEILLIKILFLPAEIFSWLRFWHFPLLFKMLYMAKLSDNAFSFKQPQKSLACQFQMSLLLALDSSSVAVFVAFSRSVWKLCLKQLFCFSKLFLGWNCTKKMVAISFFSLSEFWACPISVL